jgi:hypothetical protein
MRIVFVTLCIVTLVGCGNPQQQATPSVSLDAWCETLYQNNPDKTEHLRCETDDFRFSICSTSNGWHGLFFSDKRNTTDQATESSAFFMKGGSKLPPKVGDAGDGRFRGAKYLKTSQEFDALLFEYKLGENSTENITFPYKDGKWMKPER